MKLNVKYVKQWELITLVEVKIGKNTLENNLPIQQLFSEHIL